MVAQKLRFDAIFANNFEHQNERELNTLLQRLLVEQRDCMLMHLSGQRGNQLMFLIDAFIVQLNVKLQQLGLRLEHGHVRYTHLAEDATATGLDAEYTFNDTCHLMNWLLGEYRMRSALAKGHEALVVEYTVVSQKQPAHWFSVKFHIVLVAMEQFCLGTLCGLRCYFSNDLITAALSITELTSYMRQAADQAMTKPLHMLVLCHVRTSGCTSRIDGQQVQLLGLAQLACQQGDCSPQPSTTTTAEPTTTSGEGDANNNLLTPTQFELCHQQLKECFKLVHNSLLQVQNLKHTRQLADTQLSNLVKILLASETKLLQSMSQTYTRLQN
ncbi:maker256 [Drosophila busckii]|uniref:Maker256 n=2 Tax=Drosophila busckii TaxID=30019 RepID=A0A0M4ERM1_DROBS|nr:maker256 [Drosophila busckii]